MAWQLHDVRYYSTIEEMKAGIQAQLGDSKQENDMKCFSNITEMRWRIQELLGDSTPEELDAFIKILTEDGHLEYVDKAHHHWELHDMSRGDWRDCLMKMHGEKK